MGSHLKELGVAEVELKPGRSGQFDVEIDGDLRYSRAQTRGFPTDAEIDAMVPELPG